MKDLENLTNEEFQDEFKDLLVRINKVFEGGIIFGIDLVILSTSQPELYAEYIALQTEGMKRKIKSGQ